MQKNRKSNNIIGIIQSFLILILVVLVIFMMIQISRLQGTARVINYAGLVRGATTNINQIARKLHTDGEVPNDSTLYFLNKNILKYRKESEKIWLLIRRLISGQIHMEQ